MPDGITRSCTGCGEVLPLTAFHRNATGRNGRQSMCTRCRRARLEAGRAADPVLADERRQRAYQKLLAWRVANHDRILAINRRHHELHQAERRAADRAYRRAHTEDVRERNDLYRARKKTAFVERVSRRAIYDRDGGKCGICGKRVAFKDMHLDHIVPLALGGTHEPKNVQVAHGRCNSRKRAHGPGQLRLLE